MRLPESIARAELIYNGLKYNYGSHEEHMAIRHSIDKKNVDYQKTILPLVEKVQEADNALKALLFPHRFYTDVEESVKAKAFFEKTRELDLFIRPL